MTGKLFLPELSKSASIRLLLSMLLTRGALLKGRSPVRELAQAAAADAPCAVLSLIDWN